MVEGGLLEDIRRLRLYLRHLQHPRDAAASASVVTGAAVCTPVVVDGSAVASPSVTITAADDFLPATAAESTTSPPYPHFSSSLSGGSSSALTSPLDVMTSLGVDSPSELTVRAASNYFRRAHSATAPTVAVTTITNDGIASSLGGDSSTAGGASSISSCSSTPSPPHSCTGNAPAVSSSIHQHVTLSNTDPNREGENTSSNGAINDSTGSNSSIDVAAGSVVSSGLLQAIGYKEFDAYLTFLEGGGAEITSAESPQPLPLSTSPIKRQQSRAGTPSSSNPLACPSVSPSSPADVILAACVTSVKAVTRQYARKQARWIRNRFARQGLRMLTLDTSCRPATRQGDVTTTRDRSGGAVSGSSSSSGGSSSGDSSSSFESLWASSVSEPALLASREWLQHQRGQAPSQSTASSSITPLLSPFLAAPSTTTVASSSSPETLATITPLLPLAPPSPSSNCTDPSLTQQPQHLSADAARLFAWRKRACDVCGGRVLNGEHEWAVHVASKGHASAVRHVARAARLLAERGIVLPPLGGGRQAGEGGGRGLV